MSLKKTAKLEAPHAIFRSAQLPDWEWRVLKSWQTPKAEATNEYGMASFVYANTRGGFNVTLRDMDAEQTVPVVKMYREIGAAIAAADAMVAQ